MNWNYIAGIISIIALFSPVLLIVYYGLYRNISLAILFLYYLLAVIYNLMVQNFLSAPGDFKTFFAVAYNYLDVPMMLIALLFFKAGKRKRKLIYFTLALFAAYEIIIGFIYHFSAKSSIYILGPGIFIVLLYSIPLFLKYGRTTVVYGKNLGLTLMLVSILFAYGCFGIIYYLYYIQKTPAIADVFLVYYMVIIISSILMAAGLVWVHKRAKQIREVQLIRKELAAFFHN